MLKPWNPLEARLYPILTRANSIGRLAMYFSKYAQKVTKESEF
ncbi:MAG TPA: hypothetical protein V6D18_05035 [Thermosynechococcaceae cyanobacterium]